MEKTQTNIVNNLINKTCGEILNYFVNNCPLFEPVDGKYIIAIEVQDLLKRNPYSDFNLIFESINSSIESNINILKNQLDRCTEATKGIILMLIELYYFISQHSFHPINFIDYSKTNELFFHLRTLLNTKDFASLMVYCTVAKKNFIRGLIYCCFTILFILSGDSQTKYGSLALLNLLSSKLYTLPNLSINHEVEIFDYVWHDNFLNILKDNLTLKEDSINDFMIFNVFKNIEKKNLSKSSNFLTNPLQFQNIGPLYKLKNIGESPLLNNFEMNILNFQDQIYMAKCVADLINDSSINTKLKVNLLNYLNLRLFNDERYYVENLNKIHSNFNQILNTEEGYKSSFEKLLLLPYDLIKDDGLIKYYKIFEQLTQRTTKINLGNYHSESTKLITSYFNALTPAKEDSEQDVLYSQLLLQCLDQYLQDNRSIINRKNFETLENQLNAYIRTFDDQKRKILAQEDTAIDVDDFKNKTGVNKNRNKIKSYLEEKKNHNLTTIATANKTAKIGLKDFLNSGNIYNDSSSVGISSINNTSLSNLNVTFSSQNNTNNQKMKQNDISFLNLNEWLNIMPKTTIAKMLPNYFPTLLTKYFFDDNYDMSIKHGEDPEDPKKDAQRYETLITKLFDNTSINDYFINFQFQLLSYLIENLDINKELSGISKVCCLFYDSTLPSKFQQKICIRNTEKGISFSFIPINYSMLFASEIIHKGLIFYPILLKKLYPDYFQTSIQANLNKSNISFQESFFLEKTLKLIQSNFSNYSEKIEYGYDASQYSLTKAFKNLKNHMISKIGNEKITNLPMQRIKNKNSLEMSSEILNFITTFNKVNLSKSDFCLLNESSEGTIADFMKSNPVSFINSSLHIDFSFDERILSEQPNELFVGFYFDLVSEIFEASWDLEIQGRDLFHFDSHIDNTKLLNLFQEKEKEDFRMVKRLSPSRLYSFREIIIILTELFTLLIQKLYELELFQLSNVDEFVKYDNLKKIDIKEIQLFIKGILFQIKNGFQNQKCDINILNKINENLDQIIATSSNNPNSRILKEKKNKNNQSLLFEKIEELDSDDENDKSSVNLSSSTQLNSNPSSNQSLNLLNSSLAQVGASKTGLNTTLQFLSSTASSIINTNSSLPNLGGSKAGLNTTLQFLNSTDSSINTKNFIKCYNKKILQIEENLAEFKDLSIKEIEIITNVFNDNQIVKYIYGESGRIKWNTVTRINKMNLFFNYFFSFSESLSSFFFNEKLIIFLCNNRSSSATIPKTCPMLFKHFINIKSSIQNQSILEALNLNTKDKIVKFSIDLLKDCNCESDLINLKDEMAQAFNISAVRNNDSTNKVITSKDIIKKETKRNIFIVNNDEISLGEKNLVKISEIMDEIQNNNNDIVDKIIFKSLDYSLKSDRDTNYRILFQDLIDSFLNLPICDLYTASPEKIQISDIKILDSNTCFQSIISNNANLLFEKGDNEFLMNYQYIEKCKKSFVERKQKVLKEQFIKTMDSKIYSFYQENCIYILSRAISVESDVWIDKIKVNEVNNNIGFMYWNDLNWKSFTLQLILCKIMMEKVGLKQNMNELTYIFSEIFERYDHYKNNIDNNSAKDFLSDFVIKYKLNFKPNIITIFILNHFSLAEINILIKYFCFYSNLGQTSYISADCGNSIDNQLETIFSSTQMNYKRRLTNFISPNSATFYFFKNIIFRKVNERISLKITPFEEPNIELMRSPSYSYSFRHEYAGSCMLPFFNHIFPNTNSYNKKLFITPYFGYSLQKILSKNDQLSHIYRYSEFYTDKPVLTINTTSEVEQYSNSFKTNKRVFNSFFTNFSLQKKSKVVNLFKNFINSFTSPLQQRYETMLNGLNPYYAAKDNLSLNFILIVQKYYDFDSLKNFLGSGYYISKEFLNQSKMVKKDYIKVEKKSKDLLKDQILNWKEILDLKFCFKNLKQRKADDEKGTEFALLLNQEKTTVKFKDLDKETYIEIFNSETVFKISEEKDFIFIALDVLDIHFLSKLTTEDFIAKEKPANMDLILLKSYILEFWDGKFKFSKDLKNNLLSSSDSVDQKKINEFLLCFVYFNFEEIQSKGNKKFNENQSGFILDLRKYAYRVNRFLTSRKPNLTLNKIIEKTNTEDIYDKFVIHLTEIKY